MAEPVVGAKPNLFAIPAGAPFLDVLALGLIARHGKAPDALGTVTVLLPTRRACRALTDAFLRAGDGKPMLLPAIRPIGDIDEEDLLLHGFAGEAGDEPAIDPLRRQLLLARLVLASPIAKNEPAIAVKLAASLGELIDSAAIEEIDLQKLDGLVQETELAEHWALVLRFLGVAREVWPSILRDMGAVDAATRRIRLIRALHALWTSHPPSGPVYVAGSTGTIPATADLLGLVSRLTRGGLIVEGLDVAASDASWSNILKDPVHPQHTLARLLAAIGIDRREAKPWLTEIPVNGTARFRLFSDCLRPAEEAHDLRIKSVVPDEAFRGLRRLSCASPREEALAIALEMRGALEVAGRTAALVTPDRTLARRVAAELGRWGIEIDDSGGRPLGRTPPGAFLQLVAEMLSASFAPVQLLSVLKHPLCCAGRTRGETVTLARVLDRFVLRGIRPAPGLDGLRRAIGSAPYLESGGREALLLLVDDLEKATRSLDKLIGHGPADFAEVVEELARLVDWFSLEPGKIAAELWQREAGRALADFIDDLREAAPGFGQIAMFNLAPIIDTLMQGRVVRPRNQGHPRLFIWGQLEARLQHADLVILGGLNESVWPPDAMDDPWLNRRMRQDLGLPSPERRIGQTAHDFLMAASGPEVVLSRAARNEGAETVPSRWLLRLEAALGNDPRWAATLDETLPTLAANLDRPAVQAPPLLPPRPTPPVHARPRKLSVTQVETWIRDPYAVYARHILGLRKLDDIDAEIGASERGDIVHKTLERFILEHRTGLPADALARLLDMGRDAFGAFLDRPLVRIFWWPRFLDAAAWFVGNELERRAAGKHPLAVEVWGELMLHVPGGDFKLTAKADRIDQLPGGALGLIDYKTGKPPGGKEIRVGLAPQLPLEAAMARAGAFKDVAAAPVRELIHVTLSGSGKGGEEVEIREKSRGLLDPEELADTALKRLHAYITRFDDERTPYLSRLRPKYLRFAGDYDHLARIGEWPSEFGGDE